jgi:hypothetical protein
LCVSLDGQVKDDEVGSFRGATRTLQVCILRRRGIIFWAYLIAICGPSGVCLPPNMIAIHVLSSHGSLITDIHMILTLARVNYCCVISGRG